MEEGQEISLTRTLGAMTVTVSTCAATPVWGCAMLVRMQRHRGGMYSSQYFRSMEEMLELTGG